MRYQRLLCLYFFGANILSGAGHLFLDKNQVLDGAIEPFFVYEAGPWANVSGGLERGVRWSGTTEFGFDTPTDKLNLWPGGTFTASAVWNHGNLNSNPITGLGDGFELDNTQAANAIRAYEIKLEQVLVPNVLTVKFGQIVADDTFMVSANAGNFINSAFGDLATISTVSNYPEEPIAAPGVYLEWTFAEGWQYRTGLYTSNAGDDDVANTGFQWSLGGDAGYAWFNEVSVQSALFGAPYTLTGGFFALLDATLTDQRTGQNFTGENLYSLYLMWDQTLVGEADAPTLAAFWRVAFTPDKVRYLSTQASTDFGLCWYGPIPERDNDVFGLACNYANFTSNYRAANPTTRAQQWIIELTYAAAIIDGITIQPDLQYILNPQNAASDHALALGLLTSISF